MLAYGVKYEDAVALLQRNVSQALPDYDLQDAERDYCRRPDLAIVYIRRQLDVEYAQRESACGVHSEDMFRVKGKKIA